MEKVANGAERIEMRVYMEMRLVGRRMECGTRRRACIVDMPAAQHENKAVDQRGE
ncbi:MAG: hypothetical protein AB1656_01785 [Candidatus Omnitrophota bacterium]